MLLPDETYEDYGQRINSTTALRVAANGAAIEGIKLNIANRCGFRERSTDEQRQQLSDNCKGGGLTTTDNSNSSNNKDNSNSITLLHSSSTPSKRPNNCKNIVASGLKFVKSKAALPQIVVRVSSDVQHHNGVAKRRDNSDCGYPLSSEPFRVPVHHPESSITLAQNMEFLRKCETLIQRYNLRTDFFCQYYKAIRWVLILHS